MKAIYPLLIIVACSATKTSSERTWRHEDYPHPSAKECRTQSLRLCDPDEILTTKEIQNIDRILAANRKRHFTCSSQEHELQFGLALVTKMNPSLLGKYDDQHEMAAETFARYVHDTWGVGEDIKECGGTGVLLFLSDLDRTIFVSRGKALESVLTNTRLDKVIKNMKPLLRDEKYAKAIEGAFRELDGWIAKGEPRFWEHVDDFITAYMGLFWVGLLFYWIYTQSKKQQERRREYARVASQLDQIDQARAEALQGNFRTISCPICLEDFPNTTTDTHVGSDNKPIKLLRCGHVFDESCWSDWVNCGSGNPSKCPICQQDVGTSSTGVSLPSTTDETPDPPAEGDVNRVLRQYNQERTFRLHRLGARYPNLVQPRHVERWTQSSFDGSLSRDPEFTRNDPGRVVPESKSKKSGNLRSRKTTTFSGGSSGGGRGGRW